MSTYTALGTVDEQLEYLEDLAAKGGSTRWTINRNAEVGDELLIYLTAPISAFVARGIVSSVPSIDEDLNGDWQEHYMSEIEDVSLVPERVHIKILRARFPEWRWLISPIPSTRVPDEVLDRLRVLVKLAADEVETEQVPDADEEAIEAAEGDASLVLHWRRERSEKLKKAKRDSVMQEKGCLACESCGFDFALEYGLLAPDYCEFHHLTPLSELQPNAKTALSDLAVVCSNCHSVIHLNRPMLTPKELATKLRVRSAPTLPRGKGRAQVKRAR